MTLKSRLVSIGVVAFSIASFAIAVAETKAEIDAGVDATVQQYCEQRPANAELAAKPLTCFRPIELTQEILPTLTVRKMAEFWNACGHLSGASFGFKSRSSKGAVRYFGSKRSARPGSGSRCPKAQPNPATNRNTMS
jgi:hypothetical protein